MWARLSALLLANSGALPRFGPARDRDLLALDPAGNGNFLNDGACSLPQASPAHTTCVYMDDCDDCPNKCVPVMGGGDVLNARLMDAMLPDIACLAIARMMDEKGDSLSAPCPSVDAVEENPGLIKQEDFRELLSSSASAVKRGVLPTADTAGIKAFFARTCVDEVVETPEGTAFLCSAGSLNRVFDVMYCEAAEDGCSYGMETLGTETCAAGLLQLLNLDTSKAPQVVDSWTEVFNACQAQPDAAACAAYDGEHVHEPLMDILDARFALDQAQGPAFVFQGLRRGLKQPRRA